MTTSQSTMRTLHAPFFVRGELVEGDEVETHVSRPRRRLHDPATRPRQGCHAAVRAAAAARRQARRDHRLPRRDGRSAGARPEPVHAGVPRAPGGDEPATSPGGREPVPHGTVVPGSRGIGIDDRAPTSPTATCSTAGSRGPMPPATRATSGPSRRGWCTCSRATRLQAASRRSPRARWSRPSTCSRCRPATRSRRWRCCERWPTSTATTRSCGRCRRCTGPAATKPSSAPSTGRSSSTGSSLGVAGRRS